MFASNSASIATARANHRRGVVAINSMKGETLLYSLALIVLILVCALFYIWSRVQIVNVGYEINRKILLKDQLIEQKRKLILEGAILKSPFRLEELAKNDFGMKLPEKTQILSIMNLKSFELTQPVAKGNENSSKKEDVKRRAISQKTNLEVRKNPNQKQTQLRSAIPPKPSKKLM